MSNDSTGGKGPESSRRGFFIGAATGLGVGIVSTKLHLDPKHETTYEALKRKCIAELAAKRVELTSKVAAFKEKEERLAAALARLRETEESADRLVREIDEMRRAHTASLEALRDRIKELEAEVRRLEPEWRTLPPSPEKREV